MRIRQEIKIKFLSAAMVVLLIFSGIFGGIGYRAYAAQTTYHENDTVTISDNETENKYPEITPESTSYLYCYNQLATWDSGETMQRYYKDLRDICWDFYNGELEATYYLFWEDENDSSNNEYEWCIDKLLHKSDYNLTEDEYAIVETALYEDMPIFYFLYSMYSTGDDEDGNTDYTTARAGITIKNDDDIIIYILNRDDSWSVNYRDKSRRAECRKLIEKRIHEYYDLTKEYATNYEKQTAVFDEICLNSDYYYGDDENTQYYTHSIMGSVEKKDFVCEGYAKAAQLYLNYIGVDTILLSGYADGGGHAWNAVKLDNGKWYLSDLTWSDDSIRIDKDHFGDTAGVNSINTAFVNMPYKTFSQRHSQNLTFKALEYADDSDYYNFYDVYITLEQENTLSKEEITKIVSDKIIELLKNNISKAVIVYENFEYYEYPEVFFAACSSAFKNIYNETGVEWTYTLGEPCSSDLLWDLKDEEGNYILNENNERIKLMRSNVLFSVKEQSGEYTFLKYNIPGNGAYITASDYIGSKILNIPETLNGFKVIKIGDVNTIDCEKVILPSTVKIIGGGGFRGSKIKKIELNDGLIRIDYEAFLNCEELKSVYIPESVNVIENYAFGYVFGDNGFEKTDGFTIYGEAGSAAQKYAEDNGFAFIEGRMNEITYGDANGDGKIDSRDAVVIKKYVAGFTGFTIDLDAADVNADGKVDTRDAVKILKKIAGFDVTLGEA